MGLRKAITQNNSIISSAWLIITVFYSMSAAAQNDINRFVHLSTSDQFSLTSVTAIAQDDRGLMWFGTRNGLLRFDGVALKSIRDKGNFDAEANDILAIHIDSEGKIWMGTKKGLAVYDPVLEDIAYFSVDKTDPMATSSSLITCVQEMASGEIWVGTANGLNIFDPGKRTFLRVDHDPSNSRSLSDPHVNFLYQTVDGNIWVATRNGLNRYNSFKNGTFDFQVFRHDPGNSQSLISSAVNVLLEDGKGQMWIGTENGLDKIDISTGKKIAIGTDNPLTDNLIRALTVDRKGRLWIGTYDGINILEDNGYIHHIKHQTELSNSLMDNKIRDLFTDINGTVWVGTYYGGINYWDERQFNFSTINDKNGRRLSYNVVSAIEEDGKGNIYFGTEGEGVSIYDSKTDQYEYLNHLGNGLKIGAVKALMLDESKELWIGTFHLGLIQYHIETQQYCHYRSDSSINNSISSDQVISLAPHPDGKVWIGTLGEGLNLFDPEKQTFKTIRYDPMKERSIHSNSIRTMLLGPDKNLYVGSSKGLSMLENSDLNNPFVRFKVANESVKNLDIQDIFADHSGRIWVGTTDQGLFMVEGEYLVPIKTIDVKSVLSILEDSKYFLWLSTNEGIVKFNPKSNLHKVFDTRDRVETNEFVRSSKLLSKEGKLYFGGASGVTTFSPDNIHDNNNYSPDVILTGLQLFNEFVQVGDSTGLLTQSLAFTEEIQLHYDQNIFTLHFAMPNFINGEGNSYKYRLIGLDDNWITTSTPFVPFTLQQGGDYIFEVIGVNSEGMSTSGVTRLKIKLFPPPWKTWWAFLSYAIGILGIVFFLIASYRSRLMFKHRLDIETREFIQQQEVNRQKLQFFTNISHEFRTPLTLIAGPLQKLLLDYKGPQKFYRQLIVIKKNSDQLFKLVNELMDFRKLENKQMNLQAAEGNIVKFSKEVFLSFMQHAKLNKVDYTFESSAEEIRVFFDRDKLEKVFYNLLSNAFKFTPEKGKIAMKLALTDAFVKISVKDSGEGMDGDHIDKIFDRFYEIPTQRNYGRYTTGTGIGLAIAKSVVDLHQGRIEVESKRGLGSTFVVSLPIGNAHLSEDQLIKAFRDSEDVSLYKESLPQITLPEIKETVGVDGKKCILVVEDNTEVGTFIKGVLNQQYKIVLVENGALGYQNAISVQPDLIISDLMMPKMNGVEFCAKVKSDIRTSHIPFLLLSARTSLVYKYDGLESGADDYLYKPFEIKELLLKCKNIIHTREGLKEKYLSSGSFSFTEISVNSMDEIMMNKAFQIVHENVSNVFFDVQQFSEELGISRSLLFTKFKAWTNQTPTEFIIGIRMKQAATLIEQNKINIAEIGYKVGFKDPSYFTKTFKKHYSITPKAYSEKFRESFHVE